MSRPDGQRPPFHFAAWRLLFDLSFFIIVSTIGLNLVFGIIVDTFSELRDEKVSQCTVLSLQTHTFAVLSVQNWGGPKGQLLHLWLKESWFRPQSTGISDVVMEFHHSIDISCRVLTITSRRITICGTMCITHSILTLSIPAITLLYRSMSMIW